MGKKTKEHNKKIAARNQKLKAEKNKMQKQMQAFYQQLVEAQRKASEQAAAEQIDREVSTDEPELLTPEQIADIVKEVNSRDSSDVFEIEAEEITKADNV
jgi:hypothetical protein